MRCAVRTLLLAALVTGTSCNKVPIVDIAASFSIADAAWFAEEHTLFIFFRVQADQGLGPDSQIEITYRTDDRVVPWTPVADLKTVHTHVSVDCGTKERCGSTSLLVVKPPREIGVRLRYHRAGDVFLKPPVNVNLVGEGPAHTNRSLLVYGVFDATNVQVQWRSRHQFPALRNEQAQELGLRRAFFIAEPQHGDASPPFDTNPYGYAFVTACPPGLALLGWTELSTTDRAVFDPNMMPLTASVSPIVCARSTVTDAKGMFVAPAVARKNPEVNPAFPTLRSPIRTNSAIGFVMRPCTRVISEKHRQMQVQRLGLADAPEVCIDDWQEPNFVERLATLFRTRIDETRAAGNDMVLTVVLHHDDAGGQLADKLEQALEDVLVIERDKSSPRVSGAFVFDSFGYAIVRPQVKQLVLWCPVNGSGDLDAIFSGTQQPCTLLPDIPNLRLGPFGVGNLPIFPSRQQYLKFIGKYSDAQAGSMRDLQFRAPERTPTSQNIQLGEFGTATFFNNELVTAAASDSFSYCAATDPFVSSVLFRTDLVPEPAPLSELPALHLSMPQPQYGLGLLWDFPYLLRLRYEVVIAGSVSAFSLTAPFGIGFSTMTNYGAELWQTGEFSLAKVLLQCTRFCSHPTFDSAGVYNVNATFTDSYKTRCYRPRFAMPVDGGFPLDP